MDIELNGRKLKVFYDGDIIDLKTNKIIVVKPTSPNKNNKNISYYKIECRGKRYFVHRIVAFCYLGLNLDDRAAKIDHIDHNGLNNIVDNLRIVTNQENSFNCCNTKGYYRRTGNKRWFSKIGVNGKNIHLGTYDTEEEARNAYLEAKKKYHTILSGTTAQIPPT